jgi:copper transport protein
MGTVRWPAWGALVLALVVAVVGLGAPPAAAHAFLVSSEPPAGAVLVQAPPQVTLHYSEDVAPGLSSFAVYDSARNTVSGPPTVAGRTVVLPLRPLPPGTYTLRWRVVSADDGHVTAGSQQLVIWRGGRLPAGLGGSAAGAQPALQGGLAGLVARSAALVATFVLVGVAFAWLALGWRPPRGRAAAAGALCLAATGAAFAAQACAATGVGPWRLLAGGYLAPALSAPFGRLAMLQAAGAAVASAGMELGGGIGALGAVLGSAALVAGGALGSHPAASARPVAGAVVDGLHLAAAAAWLGALGWVLAAGRPLADRLRQLSPWAAALAAATAATGVLNALFTVHAWSALRTTPYGRVLDVKVALFLGLLGAAGAGVRELRRGRSAAARRRFLGEAGLGLGVLVAAALLVALPPADVPAGAARDFRATQQVGDLKVQLTVSPAVAGSNLVTVQLASRAGRPMAAPAVQVEVRSLDMDMGTSTLTLTPRGGAVYAAETTLLGMAGTWSLKVDAGGRAAEFTVPIAPPTGTTGACDYGFDPALHATVLPWHASATQTAVDPTAPDAVLVATADGVEVSLDGGQTWRHPAGVSGPVVAVAAGPDGTWYAAGPDRLWSSTDRGVSWRERTLPAAGVTALLASPWARGGVYVDTTSGLAYSPDGGRSWRLLSAAPEVQGVSRLAADAVQARRLWAGGLGGILVSEDGGRTWRVAAPGARLVYGFAFVPTTPETIWASAMAQGVWVSRDGGRTWTESDAGVASPGGMGVVAWGGGQYLLAGTMGGGLAASQDYGESWSTVGCPAGVVFDLAAGTSRGAGRAPVVWLAHDGGLVRLEPSWAGGG